jgi:hypothetical protein
VLFYRAALPLSSKTLNYAARIVCRHRASIGSLWRKLNPGHQALLVLAYLRKGETFAELAAGFGVGVATAWRYVNETVALLAARTPELRKAVRDAKKAGYAYVIREPPGRRSRAGERTSLTHRRKPTAPTRSSAHPAKGQTPSSRTGESSASSAAAPGAPDNSPRPSTPRKSTPHNQDEKGSVSAYFNVCAQSLTCAQKFASAPASSRSDLLP